MFAAGEKIFNSFRPKISIYKVSAVAGDGNLAATGFFIGGCPTDIGAAE
jgi:hypothetical protein